MVQVTGFELCLLQKVRQRCLWSLWSNTWRNHTWDTNDSRSLLNYILFNLSIGIVVLSRGIQKQGWCLPKLKPLYSKAISKNQISWMLYGWPWLGLRNLECSCWKAVELLQLQLSFSAELNFSSVELLQLSWAFSTPAELQVQLGSRQVQPGSRASWTGVQRVSTGVQGKFSRGFFPQTSLVKTGWTGPRGGSTSVRVTWPVWPPDWQTNCQSDPQVVEPALGVVQPVSRLVFAVWPTVCQSDWQTDCQPAPGSWTGPRGGSVGLPQPKSVQRLVLKPHLYILTPTSLPT
jgi:hypothetical protein